MDICLPVHLQNGEQQFYACKDTYIHIFDIQEYINMYTNKTLISLTNLAQQITPQNETKY